MARWVLSFNDAIKHKTTIMFWTGDCKHLLNASRYRLYNGESRRRGSGFWRQLAPRWSHSSKTKIMSLFVNRQLLGPSYNSQKNGNLGNNDKSDARAARSPNSNGYTISHRPLQSYALLWLKTFANWSSLWNISEIPSRRHFPTSP